MAMLYRTSAAHVQLGTIKHRLCLPPDQCCHAVRASCCLKPFSYYIEHRFSPQTCKQGARRLPFCSVVEHKAVTLLASHAAGGPVLGPDAKNLCPVPMLTLFKERGERGLMVPEFQIGTLLSNEEDFPVKVPLLRAACLLTA